MEGEGEEEDFSEDAYSEEEEEEPKKRNLSLRKAMHTQITSKHIFLRSFCSTYFVNSSWTILGNFNVKIVTKKKETHKIPGYQQLTGLLGSYGTTYKEQIVRTFCMT